MNKFINDELEFFSGEEVSDKNSNAKNVKEYVYLENSTFYDAANKNKIKDVLTVEDSCFLDGC